MFGSLVFTALASPFALTVANDDLAGPTDRAAIMVTIHHLLDALRSDDADGAFKLLSEEFQDEMFTPMGFLSSMRKSCAPLCQSCFIEFDALNAVNGLLVQEISLVTTDGARSTAYFLMELEPKSGKWQIGSCIVDAPPAALHA